ncbi:transglycosylase family protein [Streptomyces edwardsiae]|uniref:Transglycosylase family protein n=1 Tax=Streptomyces edwardsiae TaxID=3075527 RepID=A0ABU2QQ56_9ACTN|nr:transglycosylase family protein [Streptomyces sp. DSM 41635]MDT0405979.1 transglycosylase family protein [Streptomyces sp. DSM 41635]
MLSGNGRHRRPRQAPALLVAAGVTGSAIAIPLLGAGSASAADGLNWDKVAECESGGSWSQNSGNGYYGGLQLTQTDWEKYGGLDYASSPDQASRGQQIAVAEKILDDQGVGAWRTCGLLAGLDKDAPAADVDTGVGDDSASGTSDSSDSSGSSSSSPSPSSSPSSSASTGTGLDLLGEDSADSGKSTESDSGKGKETAGTPDTSPSASADAKGGTSDKSRQNADASAGDGTGRHRGASADEGKTEAAPSGRHASGGLNAWGGTVAEAPAASDEGGSPSIPDSLEVGGGWGALYGMDDHLVSGVTSGQ